MIEDSVSRSGKGGMDAAMKFADGAAATPSVTFTTEPTTGFFRSAGLLGLSVVGVIRASLTAVLARFYTPVQMDSTLTVAGTTTIGGNLTVTGTITGPYGNTAVQCYGQVDVLGAQQFMVGCTFQRAGVGLYDITFTTPLADVNYAISATGNGGTTHAIPTTDARYTTGFRIGLYGFDGSLGDGGFDFMVVK